MERGQAKAWQIVVLDKLHMEKFRPEADAGEAKGPQAKHGRGCGTSREGRLALAFEQHSSHAVRCA